MMKKMAAAPFLEPVDTQVYSDYLKFVKKPMDFGTILDMLESQAYLSLDQYKADVRLVFYNALAYNSDNEA